MTDNAKLIERLKYERDRMYTLCCSGTWHEVKHAVRGEEISGVINEAMTALSQSALDIQTLKDENAALRGQVIPAGNIAEVRELAGDLDFASYEKVIELLTPQPLHAEEVKES
jgi:hypothetical protein